MGNKRVLVVDRRDRSNCICDINGWKFLGDDGNPEIEKEVI